MNSEHRTQLISLILQCRHTKGKIEANKPRQASGKTLAFRLLPARHSSRVIQLCRSGRSLGMDGILHKKLHHSNFHIFHQPDRHPFGKLIQPPPLTKMKLSIQLVPLLFQHLHKLLLDPFGHTLTACFTYIGCDSFV